MSITEYSTRSLESIEYNVVVISDGGEDNKKLELHTVNIYRIDSRIFLGELSDEVYGKSIWCHKQTTGCKIS